jgi:hypothetical protein
VGGVEVSLAVDRLTEGVDDAPEQRLTDRDLDDLSGALDLVALFDAVRCAEERDTYVVLLEVEDHALDVVRELEELACHRLREAVDASDTVTGREHGSSLALLDVLVIVFNLLADDPADLFDLDLHKRLSL